MAVATPSISRLQLICRRCQFTSIAVFALASALKIANVTGIILFSPQDHFLCWQAGLAGWLSFVDAILDFLSNDIKVLWIPSAVQGHEVPLARVLARATSKWEEGGIQFPTLIALKRH